MTLTPRGRRAVLVTVAASALLAGMTAQQWDPYARELGACHTFDVPEDDTTRAPALLAAGWVGDPTDHAERLYAPACHHHALVTVATP